MTLASPSSRLVDVIELEGTPRELGEAFGRARRAEIRALYELRMANAIEQAASYGGRRVDEGWLLRAAERCLAALDGYHPAGRSELEGIAAASGLGLAQIWAMNALTDLRDVAAFGDPALGVPLRSADGEGCSSIVVHGSASSTGRALAGQTWDLATDNQPFVCVVHRRPRGAPETVCLTTVGCLSLIGLNAAGLAVGTTNLRTTDARAGVGYLDVIHRALACETFDAARSAIVDAPRAAAHFYYLLDAAGRAATFECSATRVVEVAVSGGFHVHCNHALDPRVAGLEAKGTPVASTHHRQARLTELAGAAGSIGPAQLRAFFADHVGGELAINRKDFGGISSNGSVVLEPSTRTLWAVRGPADEGTWISRTLAAWA